LNWFFDQWVYGKYRPHYELNWADSLVGENHFVNLTLNQVQANTDLFKMPLEIKILTASGDTTFVVWDSLASQAFQFEIPDEALLVELDPNGWVLKQGLEREGLLVRGLVYEADYNIPIENALILYGRVLDDVNLAAPDSMFSDNQGHFGTQFSPGLYYFLVLKDGYLPTATNYIEISNHTFNLNFALSAPEISFSTDSIVVFLDENETFQDTLKIENAGSGKLLFSMAPTLGTFNPPGLSNPFDFASKALKINRFAVNSILSTQSFATAPPVDTLWQLLYKDPQDNIEGVFDTDEIWLQIENNQLYLRVTTHQPYGPLDQFQFILAMDTDNNVNTGLNFGWFGIDKLIMVSDLGGAYGATLFYRSGDFEISMLASYEDVKQNNDEFTVGFPVSEFGSAKYIPTISVLQTFVRPLFDVDWAPDENFGYLIFSNENIPWFKMESNFGLVNASEAFSNAFTIAPGLLAAGRHELNLMVVDNQPDFQIKMIPVKLDYITSVENFQSQVPEKFRIEQNYPNPFNLETVIQYDLPTQGYVTLDIFNILGQRIYRLVETDHTAGSYSINWNGKDESGELVGSGIYFYVIKLDNIALPARKMVILK